MQLHWLSSSGGTTASFCPIFRLPRGCVYVRTSLHVCIRQEIIESVANEREAKAVTQRQTGTVNRRDGTILHEKTRRALSSLQIQSLWHRVPCNPSTFCLQKTSATESFEACGKQVLICYLCEKLQPNEGFTSYDQRWWGTWWMRITCGL